MQIAIKVEGSEEVAANLRGIAVDVRDKFMLQALKAGGEVVRSQSQANAPKGKTGSLANSITVGTKDQVVLVGPNKDVHDSTDKRKMRNDAIGTFQEKGTVNHYFGYGAFSRQVTSNQARRQKNKQIIFVGRTEERMKAHPFLGPALMQSAQAALQAEADKLRELIEARQKKG